MAVELSIVIPTREREQILAETLRRLLDQAQDLPVEVIVVYNGHGDAERREAWPLADASPVPLRSAEQPALGPAAARNRGLAMARGGAVLFLGDDVWPSPALLDRHLAFHTANPAPEDALLGHVTPAPPLDRAEFVRWLHNGGVQFAYGGLRRGLVGPECFWTANVSLKVALARAAGGFDEAFTDAACEDAELGLRLARIGMRLHYDPRAVGEHYHPTDLETTLARMRRVGLSFRLLGERAPELAMPRRPGVRHRARAAALAVLVALGARGRLRKAAWRFLCDEAQREAYWDQDPGPGRLLRIGDRLARVAIADESQARRRAGTPAPARDLPRR